LFQSPPHIQILPWETPFVTQTLLLFGWSCHWLPTLLQMPKPPEEMLAVVCQWTWWGAPSLQCNNWICVSKQCNGWNMESVFESFMHMPSLSCVQAGSVSLIQTLIDKLSLQAAWIFSLAWSFSYNALILHDSQQRSGHKMTTWMENIGNWKVNIVIHQWRLLILIQYS
jgi:hypothetical protein